MLHLEKMSTFENGEVVKRYRISEPYTVIDCLKAMIRNPDVALGHGEREGDHDVGFDSDSDHDYYSSVQEFLESVDYERYNPRFNVYNSYYFFYGTYKGKTINVSFSYGNGITLCCSDRQIDLCAMIDEASC